MYILLLNADDVTAGRLEKTKGCLKLHKFSKPKSHTYILRTVGKPLMLSVVLIRSLEDNLDCIHTESSIKPS